MKFRILISLMTVLFFAQSVNAQMDFVGARFSMRATEVQNINRQVIDRDVQKTAVDPLQSRETLSTSLTYTPSASRTRANLQAFVNKSRSADPAGAAQMEQLFASTDIIGAIGSAMRGVGLDKNNAADAFAVYWVSAWQAAYGDTSTQGSGTYGAVAQQAARGLASSPEFARATDAQKQEMAEAMMVQAAMIDAAKEQAAGDPDMLRKVGQAVMQGAKATGLDLDQMTLTEDGFVKAKKTGDASGTAAGEKALAANDADAGGGADTDSEGLTPTQLALIAAAAGAGLGGVFLAGKAMGRRG
ncbi:DUF6683 family protein [Sphingorhabdus arenilitoris]|uniref:DUF6683 family protein n=1 Tax=Sphingorhabdus arenilitoris TaxID=1490041 RepID=A0ABV8RDK8_9SPHN